MPVLLVKMVTVKMDLLTNVKLVPLPLVLKIVTKMVKLLLA